MKRQYLVTPGPTPIPPQVSQAEAMPIIHHRTGEFKKLYQAAAQGMQDIFLTKHEVYLLASSGTGAMECAVANLVNPQDEAIVASVGNFGQRWIQLVKTYGGVPVVLEAAWGDPVDLGKLEALIKEHPKAKTIWVTFTETSTGVVNDMKKLGALVRKHDRILCVDAISGLAGQELRMDDWQLDCVVAGSQKGLMLAPGLAFIAVNDRAWHLVEQARQPLFYFSLAKMRKSHADAQTPFTPAVTLIAALKESIGMIKEFGLENLWKRCSAYAGGVRSAFTAMGLELFSSAPCDVLTAAKVPAGVDGEKIVKIMREQYGISIAGGQGKVKGKIIRLAHMGYINEFDLIAALAGVEIVLNKLGFSVPFGKGVAELERIL